MANAAPTRSLQHVTCRYEVRHDICWLVTIRPDDRYADEKFFGLYFKIKADPTADEL